VCRQNRLLTCVEREVLAAFMQEKDVVHQLDRDGLADPRAKGCKHSRNHQASEILGLRRADYAGDKLEFVSLKQAEEWVRRRTKSNDPSITGRRPNFRYNGIRNNDPKPYARLGYEMSPDACAGVIPNRLENSVMYGAGPRRNALPRNEYAQQTIRIIVFLVVDH
jgi:hypothetical protein